MNAVSQGVQQEYVTQVSPPPTWETYYNYAQQLYAAGYEQQAEAYYRQAQQLYSEAENQGDNQNSAERASDSAAPQAAQATNSYAPQAAAGAANSYAPQATAEAAISYAPQAAANASSSYAPAQSAYVSTSAAAMSTANSWASSDFDEEPVKRPKRPLKKRLKIWGVTILVIVIGGYIALFNLYKKQLNQKNADKSYDGSILGRVKSATIQPMVNSLKPVFDKTIRISSAAQPLLYELNLRNTPPGNSYSGASATVDASGQNDSKQSTSEETKDTKTMGEPVSPEVPVSPTAQNEEANEEAPPAPAATGKSEGQPEGQAADSKEDGVADSTTEAPAEAATEGKEDDENQEATEPGASEKQDDTPSKKVRHHSKAKRRSWARRANARRGRGPRHNSAGEQANVQARRANSGATQKSRSKRQKQKSGSGLSDDPLGSFDL